MLAALDRVWSRIWFQDRSTSPLELARIGVGVALLSHYALATPYLFAFWGDDGWMPRELVTSTASWWVDDRAAWRQSIFLYFTAPWQWVTFHALFLLCCTALMIGWRTRWVKWIVLIGQISYDYRNPNLANGVDQILACLLLILCLAPIGRAMSLDRVRAVRAVKRLKPEATLPRYTSPWAGACTRLMQIQMALLFFGSGLAKLGNEWWTGDAVWLVFTQHEYYQPLLLDLLARQYWMVNVASWATVVIEIAFPFLIWQRRTRPFLLTDAIFLHLMFAFLMGLFYFSFVMIMGHMSFVRPEWLTRLGEAWKRKVGDMEMIYDGKCGVCVRSVAWFLSFDGLGQIKVRDFRTNPSPAIGDAQLERALCLVLPDGRTLPGFEAYRHVVLRVPGLWWQVPFFHVPVLSRLIGRRLYDWIAANRRRLSSVRTVSLQPVSE
jgi:predicted DCC family thiol-disulfide oxidoreductase YuxK